MGTALASATGSTSALSQLTGLGGALGGLGGALGGLQNLLGGGLGSTLTSLASASMASAPTSNTGFGTAPSSSCSGGMNYYGGSSGVGAGYGNSDSNRSD